MRRTIRVLCLFLCFVLLLSGCSKDPSAGNSEAASSDEASAIDSGQEQEVSSSDSGESSSKAESLEDILARAPEEYDLALTVKINPQFILYLLSYEVIAYEALNEEAAIIEPRCVLTDRLLKDVLNDIIRFSYEESFLQDGGDVSVTIVRAYTNEEEARELIEEAESAIRAIAASLGITVNAVIEIESSVAFTPSEESSSAQGEGSAQGSDSSQQGDSSEQTESSEQTAAENSEYSENYAGESSNEEGSRSEERDPYEWCPVCGGTGYCDRCHGLGTVYCDECGGTGYVTCSKCWGLGYAGYESYGPKVCDQCGGYGIVIHENCAGTGEKNCPGCYGLGTCSVCHGSGYNPND